MRVIMTERLNRAIVALLGAILMIATGILNQEEAVAGIDFNTIGLLAGMMVIVSIARKSGIFEYLAIRAAKVARGNPAGILALLVVVTAVVSALLDNVTTVLLIVPVTLVICTQLKVPPYPFLLSQVLASNIGGTATLIGDPPNIIIGAQVGLSFNSFVYNLTPVILRSFSIGARGGDPSVLGPGAAASPRRGRASWRWMRMRRSPTGSCWSSRWWC
jgi:Na+/H+ antiporter NhaD/arsenite permease-like protein